MHHHPHALRRGWPVLVPALVHLMSVRHALDCATRIMTQVEKDVGPKVATFYFQVKRSERAACRFEAVRLAYGRDTK